MTIESLVRLCTELGINLTVTGDQKDRLQVDAPKGATTADLRSALSAHKLDLIAYVRNRDEGSSQSQDNSETAQTATPEPTSLTRDHFQSTHQFMLSDAEVRKLLSGSEYDAKIIDSKDSATRQVIGAQLVAALAGRNTAEHEYARRAFMTHGYFDDTARQLQTGDSPSERAAAARELGVVGDFKATTHLIASLSDSAPEVRRAATESLGQIGDPAAISPLNDLLQRESSRQLPEAVIRHAINSISVTEPKNVSAPQKPALHIVEKTVVAPEARQKREIFAEYLSSFENREVTGFASPLKPPVAPVVAPSPVPTALPTATEINLARAEEQLRLEEEALREAAEALERKRQEAEAARKVAEDEVRAQAEKEEQVRIEILARVRAEEEARRRMAEEGARQKAEEEARQQAEQEASRHAEEKARVRAAEEAQFRLEAETLRKAAEELALKRAEAEAARKAAEEKAHRRAEEEARRRAEEEDWNPRRGRGSS